MTFISERLHGLRWRLALSRRLWRPGAQPGAALLTLSRHPSGPGGEIDWPRPGEVERGLVEVSGWVLFPSSPTARVEVLLDGRPIDRARLGFHRPDIAAAWDPPHAGIAGFRIAVDLGERDPADREASLAVAATSSSGERHELGPVAVTIVERKPPARPAPAPPPARTPSPPGELRPRVLVYTHQLDLGGGQLYLNDLLGQMAREKLAELTVVSTVDGPLREDLEELGIAVHITSAIPWEDLSSHLGRIEELVAWAGDREFDVVLINTATVLATPGAEVAEALGIPFVWAIHESLRPPVLWEQLAPGVRERADAALANAAFLVFEAEATKQLFEPFAAPGSCLTLPYGLDLKPIEAARENLDPLAVRERAGVPADAEAIVCVGTVEPRKAQMTLAQAFTQIAERHPRAHLYFVGGRDDGDSQALQHCIDAAGMGDRIELVPITPDVQPWYQLADFLVIASDVESLPRTALEAMAWETPVLATAVFGLPELIEDGETGWLCEPRDLDALAAALDRVLRTPAEQRREIGRASRALVEDRHRLDRYGRQIAELLVRASGPPAKSGARPCGPGSRRG
jgi:D-inositol-3-phosphate glycosyltransferase